MRLETGSIQRRDGDHMSNYELRFAGTQDGSATLAFLAEDAASALIIAHKRASDQCAELWRDGQKLCTIKRMPVSDDHYWQVAS